MAPYADELRIDVRELELLTGFVKKVLATNDLFLDHDRSISGDAEADRSSESWRRRWTATWSMPSSGCRRRGRRAVGSRYVWIELDKQMVADWEMAERLPRRA